MSSVKPRIQRKERYNAPMHVRKALMHSRLSKELRAKLKAKKRSVTVCKGDKVKLITGEKKGHTGKVLEVDYNDLKIYVEGVTAHTAKGTEKPRPIDPSNVEIVEGDFTKDRKPIIERR
jgi:large subunit ribosomal protein L24